MRSTRSRGRTVAIAAVAFLTGAGLALPFMASAADSNDGAWRRTTGDQTKSVTSSIKGGYAKNVILLIGDGMGDSEITVARNYLYGAGGRLPGIDALPLTGSYTTYALYNTGDNKGKPQYVTDSAASGTAWATGSKTYNNAVSVDIDNQPHDTLLELAKANGYKTGNVSTAEIEDATPAVQIAHVAARSCYGPDSASCGADALVNGGRGSIAEQLIGARADVTLGGGAATFTQTAKAGAWNGKTLWEQATARGYQTATTADQLDAITTATQTKPVLGLFSSGNFPTRFAATTATVGGADQAPVTCSANADRLDPRLSLKSMTTKAIDLLKTPSSSSKGFFLQVEGASIDKQDHAANACGQIGETQDLDEAVQAALDFAKKDGNTLVLVTADHAHTSQIVETTPPATLSTALTTADGTTMKVAYGTAAAGGSQQHTGSQVRIAGYGPQAANIVGLTDQTDTFYTMVRALHLVRSLPALSEPATATASVSGNNVVVRVTGMKGDRQVTANLLEPGTTSTKDLVDGHITLFLPKPATSGTYTVAVTGAQTETAITVTITI